MSQVIIFYVRKVNTVSDSSSTDHINMKNILQPAYTKGLIENNKNWDGVQPYITPFDVSAAFHHPWQHAYEALCRGQGIKMVQ